MRKIKQTSDLYAYLESRNVLSGTDAEIKEAKRAFWRQHRAKLRQKDRQLKYECNIGFSKKSGEYGKIAYGAKKHGMPVAAFVRHAALAYLDRRYLVVAPHQVARIEGLLMACVNEVQKIVSAKEKYGYEREQKFDAIAGRIAALEVEIRQALVYPKELSLGDTQDHPV